MSINAQERLLIVLRGTGDSPTAPHKSMTAHTLTATIHTLFPDRSYNFGTVVLYMGRLRDRFMVSVVYQNSELHYRLTRAGLDEAIRCWNKRTELGYQAPRKAREAAKAESEITPTST